jgi:hypothetical protein
MPFPSAAASPATIALANAHDRRVATEHLVRVGECLLLLAIVVYVGTRALPRTWERLNTDFPNYYITARLVREGYSTNRLYEWIWLQRQKNRMGITRSDQPVVGFVPDTPFSALLVWPLTSWAPLVAKRVWIIVNILLLVAVAVMFRAITRLPWRRLALLIGLCYPLLRNFEYGQYYLVLLLLVTGALWLYLKGRCFLAGALMGVGAGLKIFPALFVLYFLRKRDLPAAIGLLAGATVSVIASLAVFGLQLHRTYLTQILPWALRGEALDPYNLGSNSLSSLLHKLFLFEPQWNRHPVLHAPGAFAALHPLLQLLILAPAVYLAIPNDRGSRQIQLEWCTFLVAVLAISTLPASYHFTVLILPVAVLAARFLELEDYASLSLLFILYLAICFPGWSHGRTDGWWAVTAVPRLYFVLLLCGLCYVTLFRAGAAGVERRVDRWVWAAALAVALVVQSASTRRHQRGVYDRYHSQIATAPDVLLAAEPIVRGNGVGFIAMRTEGYSADTVDSSGLHQDVGATDQLSQTSNGKTVWIEEATTPSAVVRTEPPGGASRVKVADAEFPVVSPNGGWLAYLRSVKGRNSIWLRTLLDSSRADVAITAQQFDVEEMTFLPDGSLIFAAMKDQHASALYVVTADGVTRPLDVEDARYPAASPDGRWLAYSQLDRGVWNLCVRDWTTGVTRRLTDAACNDISPAWQGDSKTLLYASDCGRALWFTALYRQAVIR